jgi:hypothetical protein
LINKKISNGSQDSFNDNDIKVFKDVLVLAGAAIKNAKLYEQTLTLAESNKKLLEKSNAEKEKTKILLEVARLTSSAEGVDSLIKNILDCAKKFVNAEITSLFLVDAKKNELYASVFEASGEKQKIRFP